LPGLGLPYLRRSIGLILQAIHLLNDRSALHNVMLPLKVLGIAPQTATNGPELPWKRLAWETNAITTRSSFRGVNNSAWRLHGQLLTDLLWLLQTSPLLI